MIKAIGIIPARMESSRFPGKPLKKICHIPMIGHVYLRSKLSNLLDEVYVATCNNEIHDYILSIGGKSIMTSNKHQRASDRTAEAVSIIEKKDLKKINFVCMIQGDEPLIYPDMINEGLAPMINDSNIKITNLMSVINSKKEWSDPNEVKVVANKENYAMYFSREPIPSNKKFDNNIEYFKQVCIISFDRKYLLEYCDLEPTPLEIIESVDMNRCLEYGTKVKMVKTDYETFSVDTQEELKKVEKLMKNDKLFSSYK